MANVTMSDVELEKSFLLTFGGPNSVASLLPWGLEIFKDDNSAGKDALKQNKK